MPEEITQNSNSLTTTDDSLSPSGTPPSEKQAPVELGESSAHENFAVETILHSAFERTKERFFTYLLSVFLLVGMNLAGVVVLAVIIGAHFILYLATQNVVLVATAGVISAVLTSVGLIYIASWGTLATTFTIISKEKVGVIEAYKKMRPLIWGYASYSLLALLFFVGLFPLSIFTFFLLIALWIFWGSFAVFVYIEKQPKGLGSLWMSRAIINTRFWGVLGRVVLVNGLVWTVYVVLGALTRENELLNGLVTILSYITAPFLMSYMYEIYSRLQHPADYQKQTVWIVLSIIGGVILAFAVVSIAAHFTQSLPDILQNFDTQIRQRQTSMI